MAHFEIEGDRLQVRFSTWERIGGLRGGADVALSDVESVEVSATPWSETRGIRVGTGVPYVVLLGTMLRSGKNDVVAVYGKKPIVVVSLKEGAPYQRLLVTIDEPESVADNIRAAAKKNG